MKYSECLKEIAETLRSNASNEGDSSKKNALNRSAVSKIYYACMHWCAEIVADVTDNQIDFRKHSTGTNYKIMSWVQSIPTNNYTNQTTLSRDYEDLRRKRNIADYKNRTLPESFVHEAFDIADRIFTFLDTSYVSKHQKDITTEAQKASRKTKRAKPAPKGEKF